MNPVTLDHRERYGDLTVLQKMRSGRYRVVCACGNKKDKYTAKALMRANGVRKCSRCRAKLSCKDGIAK